MLLLFYINIIILLLLLLLLLWREENRIADAIKYNKIRIIQHLLSGTIPLKIISYYIERN